MATRQRTAAEARRADVDARSFSGNFGAIVENVEQVIQGKSEAIRLAVICMVAEGHLLIEDVPGVGKTSLAKALATSLGGKWQRIQFTPDLLPSDVTGVTVFSRATSTFEFRPGGIFANLVLGDEINRASPKTQAALLEAMEERTVTVDATTYALPHPFMVIATQNPIEHEGTYELPEAQLDRFLMKLTVGYPDRASELAMLDLPGVSESLPEAPPLFGPAVVLALRARTRAVRVAPPIKEYAVDLVRATRDPSSFGLGDLAPLIDLGASPRATLALVQASRAHALLSGRDYVTPHDVKSLARDVLRHRVQVSYEADAEGLSPDAILGRILDHLRVP